jgi:hypothetical protein
VVLCLGFGLGLFLATSRHFFLLLNEKRFFFWTRKEKKNESSYFFFGILEFDTKKMYIFFQNFIRANICAAASMS